jgi:hypothetical protein
MFCIDMQDKVAEKGKGSADGRAAPAPGSAPGKEGVAAPPSSDASAPTAAAAAAAAAAPATEPNGMPGGGKKEKKPKKEKAPAAPAVKQPASITALDIRVGKVGPCNRAVYLFAANGRVA